MSDEPDAPRRHLGAVRRKNEERVTPLGDPHTGKEPTGGVEV